MALLGPTHFSSGFTHFSSREPAQFSPLVTLMTFWLFFDPPPPVLVRPSAWSDHGPPKVRVWGSLGSFCASPGSLQAAEVSLNDPREPHAQFGWSMAATRGQFNEKTSREREKKKKSENGAPEREKKNEHGAGEGKKAKCWAVHERRGPRQGGSSQSPGLGSVTVGQWVSKGG